MLFNKIPVFILAAFVHFITELRCRLRVKFLADKEPTHYYVIFEHSLVYLEFVFFLMYFFLHIKLLIS